MWSSEAMDGTRLSGYGGVPNLGLTLDEECPIEAGMEDIGDAVDHTEGCAEAKRQRSRGSALSFTGLGVDICKRQILTDVSGTVLPGELMAIMGPNGSGKTTLIRALSGRLQAKSGQISLDGQVVSQTHMRRVLYVMQQDEFFPSLTVWDTLLFQAQLRLLDSINAVQRREMIVELATDLRIQHCLHTTVGDGLSHGERKRLHLACGLLSDPAVLLLDEPTTGLDSGAAHGLFSTLQHYAKEYEKTILCSIHNPSPQILSTVDKLLLLSRGEVVYCGEVCRLSSFLEDLGMPCSSHYSPADYLLDKLEELPQVRQITVTYSKKLRASTEKQSGNAGPQSHTGHAEQEQSGMDGPSAFRIRFCALALRNYKLKKGLFPLSVVNTSILAVLIGAIWFQIPKEEEHIKTHVSAVFVLILYWFLAPVSSAAVSIIREYPVVKQELLADLYPLPAYFLAKELTELGLLLPFVVCHFSVAFCMAGLYVPLVYITRMAVVVMCAFAAQAAGLLIGALFSTLERSLSVVIVFTIPAIIVSGLLCKLPAHVSWVQYLSMFMHTYQASLQLQFSDDTTFRCAKESIYRHCRDAFAKNPNLTAFIPAEEILAHIGPALPVGANVMILLLFLLAFLGGAYVTLCFFR